MSFDAYKDWNPKTDEDFGEEECLDPPEHCNCPCQLPEESEGTLQDPYEEAYFAGMRAQAWISMYAGGLLKTKTHQDLN